MSLELPSAYAPSLEDAIERHPLIVGPNMSVVEVIALISQSHSRACGLVEAIADTDDRSGGDARSSCVLVMDKTELLGIVTERDVVRLAADAVDLVNLTVSAVMIHPVITLPQTALQDIFAALFLFRRYRIRHLPVIDDDSQLMGVISHESIRQILRPANLLRFRRVSDVMSKHVIHASMQTSVLQLAQMMAQHRVSCVVITQLNEAQNEQPVGIVTERDIVQFQAFQINLAKTQAQAVMSTPLFLLNPEDSLWVAHQAMQQRRVGRLVVSWNWGQGLGLVTQTSLLRVFDPMEMYGVIENLQETIQTLQAKLPHSAAATSSVDLAQVAYGRFAANQAANPIATNAVASHALLLNPAQPTIQPPLSAEAATVPASADGQPGRNSELVESLLDRMQQVLLQGIVPDLPPDQKTRQLQAALEILGELRRTING